MDPVPQRPRRPGPLIGPLLDLDRAVATERGAVEKESLRLRYDPRCALAGRDEIPRHDLAPIRLSEDGSDATESVARQPVFAVETGLDERWLLQKLVSGRHFGDALRLFSSLAWTDWAAADTIVGRCCDPSTEP